MWRLCVLCVLLSSVSAAGKELPRTPTSANTNSSDAPYKGGENHRTIPAGSGPGASNHTDIYARLGSEVLLPLTYNLTRDEDPQKCDEFEWSWRPDGSTNGDRISRSKRCERPKLNIQKFPNYSVSQDGRLTISNVTSNDSGNYLFTVHDCCNGLLKRNHSYTLHVQALVHDVFAASGETLVLPQSTRLQYTSGSVCNQLIWTFKAPGGYLRQLAKVSEYCIRQECDNETAPRCSLSSNGSLWLYGVKPGDGGQYKITTYNVRREKNTEDFFNLQVLGLDPTAGNHTDISARPGSDVFLPLTHNLTRDEDPKKCDQFIWIYTGAAESALIARCKGCEMKEHHFWRISNYSISLDGCLTLINVTSNISGNYTVGIYTSGGQIMFSHNYALHIQGIPKTTAEDSGAKGKVSEVDFFWKKSSTHVFSHVALCVLFSLLLLCLLTDLWKMKKYS